MRHSEISRKGVRVNASFLLLLLWSTSCSESSLPPGSTKRTIEVDGATRTYVLYIPSTNTGTEPVPLIIDFHPLGGSGPGEQSISPYPEVTDAEGVIMAFPTGLDGPMGGRVEYRTVLRRQS
jgi:polyhydroxybutyrate depolymerase